MTHLFFPSSRGLFEQFPKYHYTSLFEQQARPNVQGTELGLTAVFGLLQS
jgi:hypothetical protein